jgi:hypothetical protein
VHYEEVRLCEVPKHVGSNVSVPAPLVHAVQPPAVSEHRDKYRGRTRCPAVRGGPRGVRVVGPERVCWLPKHPGGLGRAITTAFAPEKGPIRCPRRHSVRRHVSFDGSPSEPPRDSVAVPAAPVGPLRPDFQPCKQPSIRLLARAVDQFGNVGEHELSASLVAPMLRRVGMRKPVERDAKPLAGVLYRRETGIARRCKSLLGRGWPCLGGHGDALLKGALLARTAKVQRHDDAAQRGGDDVGCLVRRTDGPTTAFQAAADSHDTASVDFAGDRHEAEW